MRDTRMITRRRALRTIGLGALTGAAGCVGGQDGGGGQNTGDEETAQTEQTAEETEAGGDVQRGGTLRAGIIPSDNITSIHGLLSDSGGEVQLNYHLRPALTDIVTEPDIEVVPRLATSWEPNDDSTQWTFELNEDATWHHNSKQVTAEDVAETYRVIYQDDSPYTYKGLLGPIDTVEALDGTTVRFNLSEPDGSMPIRQAPAVPIYPADVVRDQELLEEKSFGYGPFTLEEWESGGKTVLKAVDDYWQTGPNGEQLPYVDELVLHVFPDPPTIVTAMENGNIDFIESLPISQWDRVESQPDLNPQLVQKSDFVVIQMKADEPPFDDKRVRNAFKWAVDREELLQGAVGGLGRIANDTPVGKTYRTYTPLEKQRSQDMEKAERLLQEAGYGEGGEQIELTMIPPNAPARVLDTAIIATEQLNKLTNVSIDVQQQSYDTWINETWTKAQFYPSWYSQRKTAEQLLNTTWHSQGPYQEASWSNSEFDKYAEMAARVSDLEKQKEAISKCMQILWEEGPSIIPFFNGEPATHQNWVHNWTKGAIGAEYKGQIIWLDENSPTK